MGKIEVLGKWNLQTADWSTQITEKQRGRSSSIGVYEDIIVNPTEGINYIIIALGSRVEDHSKDYATIKEKEISVNKIISYFSKQNKNIAIRTFLMDADAPIKEDAKLIANYIDSLANQETTSTINLIGVSKCGTMSFYVPKFFTSPKSYKKTNIYTIASPFTGTKMASPKIFYPEVRKLISSIIGDTKLTEQIYQKLISIYEGISSNSHMDYDIAIPGGVPEEKSSIYDESFIRDIFTEENIAAVERLNSYQNFITGIDKKTLPEAIKTGNTTGVGLCIIDKLFFEETSDGLVPTKEQHKVEEVLTGNNFKTHTLTSAHHDVIGTPRQLNEVLWNVTDTIEEQEERKIYSKKA